MDQTFRQPEFEQPVHNEIDATLSEELDISLQDLDPSPFSPSAFENLKDKIIQYTNELVTESIRSSRRQQADTVSSTHVDKASEYLVSLRVKTIVERMGTVGGILLGAG